MNPHEDTDKLTPEQQRMESALNSLRHWVVPNGYAGGTEGDPTTAVMVRLDELRAVLREATEDTT